MSSSIDELAKKAFSEGNPGAWSELFKSVSAIIFRRVRSKVKTNEEAEDLLQTMWHRLISAKYDPTRPFLPLAFTVINNLMKDKWRADGRRPTTIDLVDVDPVSRESQPIDSVIEREFDQQVQECLKVLWPVERAVFVLRVRNGLGYEAIAAELGITTSSARGVGFRAIHKLLTCLGLRSSCRKKFGASERESDDDVLHNDDPTRVKEG